jgi:RNA polymerase sigma factor (sigma-70 family)
MTPHPGTQSFLRVAAVSDSIDRRLGPDLTEESFQLLLDWLGPDRNQAGEKYEAIRNGLIQLFQYRGCLNPEDLADETINRVARRVEEVSEGYEGEPTRYFYAVAKRVYQEQLRREVKTPPPPAEEDTAEAERMHECLSKCIETLSPASRDLILQYYAVEKRANIDARRELASKLGVQSNALRVRVLRIRNALRSCMEDCMRVREG